MPERKVYMDKKHYDKYTDLTKDEKRELNSKHRKRMYKDLDKLRKD